MLTWRLQQATETETKEEEPAEETTEETSDEASEESEEGAEEEEEEEEEDDEEEIVDPKEVIEEGWYPYARVNFAMHANCRTTMMLRNTG